MCVLGRWCDAAKIQWALLRKKKPRNEVRSLDMLGVGFGWQRQMRIGTFYQTKEKKDQEHRKMAHKFHGKKFVRPANIHKTHSHSHQTVNQQSHHWFILSQSFHLISNDYGWYGAIVTVGRCLWLRHRLHFHVTHQHVTRINGLWAMWQQQQRTANSDRPRNHCRKWCKFRIFPSTIDWLSIQMAQIEIVLRCLSKFQVYLQQQQQNCTQQPKQKMLINCFWKWNRLCSLSVKKRK